MKSGKVKGILRNGVNEILPVLHAFFTQFGYNLVHKNLSYYMSVL